MATSTPNRTVEPTSSAAEKAQPPTTTPPTSNPQPPPLVAKPEIPSPEPKTSSDANLILVPSHSRWFSWDSIHECEIRNIPESSKNPKVYKYYRNSIVKFFRLNPNRKITFTDVRKTLVGDVGSIRRVFDFLEVWGLINYHPSSSLSKPLTWEDKDTKPDATSNSAESPSPASVKEAKRIRKNEWTEKETLNLLEAITNFGDDWERVAHQVVGRTDKECVARFLELPFGDQLKPPVDTECESETVASDKSSKRMCLTPLEDASNPIMAQAAFLSALAGTEVAQAAAQAALTSLSNGGNVSDSIQGSLLHANLQLEKEESDSDVEKAISEVIEVQMKNIQDKLINFEDLDMLMEKERQQLEQTKSLYLLDQLNLIFRKTS